MDDNNNYHSENKSNGKSLIPVCTASCPLNVDVRAYVRLIALREFERALSVIIADNPLPSVCGRVCTHPCEIKCRLSKVDEPVSIRAIKGFVSKEISKLAPPKSKHKLEKKVAVVGSGPSGLSCAYFLARWGYNVTVFEAKAHAGGMLYYGIPDFRLPKDALKADIDFIKKAGVEIKTNHTIGAKETLHGLLASGYDAVYVAVGSEKSVSLGVLGEDANGVYVGFDFLSRYNAGEKISLGNRVVVVGGGDVSIDAARCAIRCGARNVKVLYRRSREDMPANKEEVDAALKDGVAFEFLSIPLRLLGKEGEVSGIECVKVRLGEPDESGRKRPMPIPGSEFTLDADSVIVAIRQKPDLSFFKSDGLLTGVDGLLEVNPEMLMTDISGVFAGGDVVSGPSCILEAMAYGRKASESIHCFLSGKKYVPHEVCAGVSELSDETAERVKRIKRVSREPSSFSDGDAVNEALRCLGCGFGATVDPERCVACLECVRVCPYNVPKIVDGKAVIDLNECQSCGFCFAECPASAISMSDGLSEYFEERVLSLRKESSKTKKLLVICCSRVLEMLPEVKNPAYISRLVVDCVGRLPSERILKLFNEGFSSVIFVSCDEGMCTHRRGNKISEKRIKRLANILKEVSLGEKLRFSEISNLLEYS